MSEHEEEAPSAEELAAAEALRRSLEAHDVPPEHAAVLGLLRFSQHGEAGDLGVERKRALRRQLLDTLRGNAASDSASRDSEPDHDGEAAATGQAAASNEVVPLAPPEKARTLAGRRRGAQRRSRQWALVGAALSCAAALALWFRSRTPEESASLQVAVRSPRVGALPPEAAAPAGRALSAGRAASKAAEAPPAPSASLDSTGAARNEGGAALEPIARAAHAYRLTLESEQPLAVRRAVSALEAAETAEARRAAYRALANLTPRTGGGGEARRSDSSNVERARSVYCRLAEVALQLGNPEQAKSWSEQGLALGGTESPLLAQLWALKGRSLEQLGEREAAAESYLSAIAIHESLLERRLKGARP